ncbi:MAG: glutathione S-transferase family protein, partial [Phenylobacterium sp.]|nr:glutathione S-transferase family protein [Phenylobacterium sp.]
FLALNPAGQVPLVILDDGRPLAQSNAIILHLARGSDLIPRDPYLEARMLEWMFWEQYSHEPYVAVARFRIRYLGRDRADLDPDLLRRAEGALDHLEGALTAQDWLVGSTFSLADMALFPYTRFAPEAAFVLDKWPAVAAWVTRCETALGLPALVAPS